MERAEKMWKCTLLDKALRWPCAVSQWDPEAPLSLRLSSFSLGAHFRLEVYNLAILQEKQEKTCPLSCELILYTSKNLPTPNLTHKFPF